MTEILYKDEAYKIIGACMEVYNEMGHGFLEAVYQECLELEFGDRGIPFASQRQLSLSFKGRKLKTVYVPDFFCFEKIVVEIKGVSKVTDSHRAQTINYLKATEMRLGLLVNFGDSGKLVYERLVN